MGVNSTHYVGSNWPNNEGSYNWDAELTCSWNASLSSAFSRWGTNGRELRPAFWHCCGIKTRASSFVRRGLRALCLGIVVILGHGFRVSRLDTVVMLGHGFWALRLGIAVVLRRGFELCVLALQWCWDAGIEPCVLDLHEWLWLASRLKHGPCYLMTCLQWF